VAIVIVVPEDEVQQARGRVAFYEAGVERTAQAANAQAEIVAKEEFALAMMESTQALWERGLGFARAEEAQALAAQEVQCGG